MKKIISVVAAVALLSMAFTGCAKKDAQAAKGGADKDNKIVVWSFTDELDGMIKNYFEKDPRFAGKYDISYSLTPTDQFPNKLDPVLASGSGCPDVFALEDAFVRKYIESGLLLDLTDVYNEVKDKMYAYPAEVGTYNGKVYGLSWQVTPGALFYNRDVAKKYLGTDDPAKVQEFVSSWDKVLKTAALLKSKSNGNCYFVSTTGDLFKPYASSRKDPWVVNGKLVIDPAMEAYLDMCKTFHDKGYEGRVGQWSEGWYAGMKGDFRDESGALKEVFAYFLPTWGLHYVLKTNAPDAAGKWAMCAGPIGYRWGGTWVGAYKGTKNPNAAKELIKYLASDDTFLEQYVKDSGDVVSNKNVVNKVKDNFSEPYLAGQNHYAEFASMAENVNGKLTQGTDQAIESLWNEATTAYMNGEKTKEKAIADFKAQVSSQLGF